MGVIGASAVALFSGFASGFFTMQMARENLRATQIMLEKTETVHLYTWEQLNTAGFVLTNFTAAYDPSSMNGSQGVIYQGQMIIAPCPIQTTFSNDMRMVTVTLNWSTGSLNRSRSFTTFIARHGVQNYIY